LDEGVFFGQYHEGVPGMQPERLGPYTSTLNPGYDPSLPLYRPWPMFDAIRDANTGITNSHWANHPDLTTPIKSATSINQTNAIVSYLPENGNHLIEKLGRAGVKASVYSTEVKTDFLLIDGSATSLETSSKSVVDHVLAQGGTVWIWNVQPAGAANVSKLLGHEVHAESRVASCFVVKQSDPLLAGLDNARLYFSEDDDWRQMSYSLAGEFVSGSKILLEASPANWRKWNYQGEPVKTAALYRSEVENISPLSAIVVRPVDHGRVILCNLDPEITSAKKAAFIGQLFRNEGIQLNQIAAQNEFVDISGRLVRALVCGAFAFTNSADAYNQGRRPVERTGMDSSRLRQVRRL
jgi:beta-galactosidase